MSDIKQRVKGQVHFVHYQDGNLIYRCDDGFEFPVPLSECGSARFPAHDKAMLFMRWIRKHMSFLTTVTHAVTEESHKQDKEFNEVLKEENER